MINANQPAQDYEFLWPFAFANSGPNPANGASCQETWGEPFVHGIAGFSAGVFDVQVAGVGQHSASCFSPQGDYNPGPSAGMSGGGTWRIYITNYQLVKNPDCSFTVSWDAFDAYFTPSGGAESHLLTFGAFTRSGTGYDERLNKTAFLTSASTGPVGSADCVPANTHNYNDTSSFGPGGYRRKDPVLGWTEDDVQYKTAATGGGCTNCFAALTQVGGTKSMHVSASSSCPDIISDGAHKEYDCECTTNPASLESFDVWLRTKTRKIITVTGSIKNKLAIVGEHQDAYSWTCNDLGVSSSGGSTVTYTPGSTYGEQTSTIDSIADGHYCNSVIGFNGIPCIDGGFTTCYPFGSTHCEYTGSFQTSWLTAPPCSSVSWPWNLETPHGRFFRVDIENGDVWAYGSGVHIPAFDTSIQVTSSADVIRPVIAIDTRERLILTYTRIDPATHVASPYYRIGDDEASSFGAETSLGIVGGKYAFVACGSQGDVIFGAFVYDSGHTGPGKIYLRYWDAATDIGSIPAATALSDGGGTPISFADDIFCLAFTKDARRLYLHARADGDGHTSVWFSEDESESFGHKQTAITDGHYPLITLREDESLVMAALVYDSGSSGPGKIYERFQAPWMQWSDILAQAPFVDGALSALESQDTSFGLSAASHESDAWVLSTILNSDTSVSEHQCWHEDEWSFLRV